MSETQMWKENGVAAAAFLGALWGGSGVMVTTSTMKGVAEASSLTGDSACIVMAQELSLLSLLSLRVTPVICLGEA